MMGGWQIECKDILTWCKEYSGPKFHSLLADPPYSLNFMNKKWDDDIAFQPATWAALSEHLLPGAFIFVFGSSRGWHRLAVAIEDAEFVFHPSLMIWGWASGSGFPKATRIDTQIDRAAGAEREIIGPNPYNSRRPNAPRSEICKQAGWAGNITAPATDLARAWEGHRYGRQALKPAVEMIICAQKPYEGKPVECIVETGAGSLWIDGGRVGTEGGTKKGSFPNQESVSCYGDGLNGPCEVTDIGKGRWPPNFCLVHSPDCQRAGMKRVKGSNPGNKVLIGDDTTPTCYGDYNKRSSIGHADADGLETVAAYQCSESCAARRIGEQSGPGMHGAGHARDAIRKCKPSGQLWQLPGDGNRYGDTGTAARFFPQFDWAAEVAERLANSDQVRYCAKASRSERDAGLDQMETKTPHAAYGDFKGTPEHATNMNGKQRCVHPCVKPIALCRWLATLLLPPPEYAPRRILIPFSGVSSEGIGALLAGFDEIVMIEQDAEYCKIGEARMQFWSQFSSYEAAMEAARNIQQSHRKQNTQSKSGQLKMTL